MFARYFVELPISPEEVEQALSQDPPGGFPGWPSEPTIEGMSSSPRWGSAKPSASSERSPSSSEPPSAPDPSSCFRLRWAASGGADLFPSLDADLEVAPIRPGRTQLAMSARYVPPFGTVGRVIDRAVLSRVAEATLKDFLDRVADAIMGSREVPSPAEPRRVAPAPA